MNFSLIAYENQKLIWISYALRKKYVSILCK